ncbi:MAG: riboflavin transporter [Candidatus Atribacteria bacterium]|nr:riboflavin transporter [Candidatus Atribacteria bacterium]
MKQKRLVYAGAFSGLSLVLALLIHFPIVPQAPFLLYDPGDIPILILGFKLGPFLGVTVTAIVSVLFALVTGEGGPWGVLMHLLATGTYVAIAGGIYHRKRTQSGAVVGLVLATLGMTGVMIVANLLITPLYLGASREAVATMLVPAIIPFNLLKGVINGVVTFLVYKKVSRLLEEPDLVHSGTETLKSEG